MIGGTRFLSNNAFNIDFIIVVIVVFVIIIIIIVVVVVAIVVAVVFGKGSWSVIALPLPKSLVK